jgi:peptidoglycan/LPS O-acetylase OafA/YrhL
MIVGLTASPDVPVRRLLESRPALWIGRRSYAIYLWHLPLLVLSRTFTDAPVPATLLGIAGTLVAAELSFRYVERPALLLRAQLAGQRTRRIMPLAA